MASKNPVFVTFDLLETILLGFPERDLVLSGREGGLPSGLDS